MKTIVRISAGCLVLGAAAVLAFVQVVSAQSISITYPVPELGNCGSEGECRIYCDTPDNREVCIAFAEKQGIIETGKANQMRAVTRLETDIMAKGPGGCVTPQECDAFCRVEENLRECLSYGVNEGFMTQAEADEIIAKAERGGPGGCKSESECRAFCGDQTHARECLQFAADEGKISQEEADFLAERAGGARPRPSLGVADDPPPSVLSLLDHAPLDQVLFGHPVRPRHVQVAAEPFRLALEVSLEQELRG